MVGFIVLVVSGLILCRSIFYTFVFAQVYGIPAIAAGAVVGAIVAAILNRRASLGMITLVTTAVTFAALLIWVFTH